jgi:hypothetical protein
MHAVLFFCYALLALCGVTLLHVTAEQFDFG